MKESTIKLLKYRPLRQKFLSLIVIITIGLGWKYPWIAYSVPIVMVANILTIFLKKGRIVCGNFCPRGSFFDRVMGSIGDAKIIPSFLRGYGFRWGLIIILVGFFIFQVLREPVSFDRLGYIFWMMCTTTTILGVILGVFFGRRAWCAFCPVGTIISTFSQDEDRLTIDKKLCVYCGLCEKKCPMKIDILQDREIGVLSHRDCIKCGECISYCPKKALR